MLSGDSKVAKELLQQSISRSIKPSKVPSFLIIVMLPLCLRFAQAPEADGTGNVKQHTVGEELLQIRQKLYVKAQPDRCDSIRHIG